MKNLQDGAIKILLLKWHKVIVIVKVYNKVLKLSYYITRKDAFYG